MRTTTVTRTLSPHADQPPDEADLPLLLSVPQAARLLGVGTTFGWTMVNKGEIPSVRLGRRVLVPRAAIERIADSQHIIESRS
jgi:excisionase family DNA binding protein